MDLSKYFLDAPAELDIQSKNSDLQLLKVFAYNAYFDADPLNTDDVNNGCTYRRDNKGGIDGVYLNQTLEDTAIECVISYFVGSSSFSLTNIYRTIDKVRAEIENVSKKVFTDNPEADNLLRDYLDESDNNKVIIRIITDYDCDQNEKYDINKKIENYDVKVKNLDVSATISFGKDIESVIESNRAPFDWVEEGLLITDVPNNYLKYEDHSIICNISAKSLHNLWEKEGNRGLLAMNLRYFIKASNVDDRIEESIMFDGDNFWYLNNGIIIVCNDYSIVNNELRLKQFSIVNGGQTSRMIGNTPFDKDFYITCKVIKNVYENANDKNIFISKVAEASNTQKPIKAKDVIANKIEQRNLKSMMAENKVFIEIKRGEKCNKELYPEPWQRTKNNELAQDLYSFIFMEPGPSRNSVSSILQNNDKYNTIFKEHKYSFPLLRDILFLEKAYKEYQKKVNKENDEDDDSSVKKGLVKNGLWYCLATIGYLLKLLYNKEYRDCVYKYRNQETKFELFSTEMAFDHAFIDRDKTYKEFVKESFDLFDIIFTQLIVYQYKLAKNNNPSIVYSNWTKSNTGFNDIRNNINFILFDLKKTDILDSIANFFVKIDEDTENQNIDNYVDYCNKNRKIKAKDTLGNTLSAEDEALRNDLMIFRMNYAANKHIPEKNIFTDKMIDKMIIEKPVSLPELKKIVSANTCYYCGDKILEIITKHI